jgi:hypothetical protein
MRNTRRGPKPVSAETIARLADKGNDVCHGSSPIMGA